MRTVAGTRYVPVWVAHDRSGSFRPFLGGGGMRRTEALQGVRMAMFLNLVRRWESAQLNQEEAAEEGAEREG